MGPQEQGPSGAKTGRLTLPPMVWEKMREHTQEVAHQIEERVQHVLTAGRHSPGAFQAPAVFGAERQAMKTPALEDAGTEIPAGEIGLAELQLVPLPDLHGVGRQRRNQPVALVITRFPCLLGRGADCDLCFDDLRVSRRHALFTL
jgi:hypothetical protein